MIIGKAKGIPYSNPYLPSDFNIETKEGGFAIVNAEEYRCGKAIMPDWYPHVYVPNPHYRNIQLSRFNGYQCLGIGEITSSDYPPIDKITQKLTCPYIFGDDIVRTIVSYWKPREDKALPIGKYGILTINYCYRIEIDGKVFPVTQEKIVRILNEEEKIDIYSDSGIEEITYIYSVAWVVL